MITKEELDYRQPIVQKLLEQQLSGPAVKQDHYSAEKTYATPREASKIAGRNSKMLWRLFNLYGLAYTVLPDSSVLYALEDLDVLVKDKKPKGMKAVGLGTIHKALLYRLKQTKVTFETEKRFTGCKLPFDFYLPNQNIAIEVQGPQHFFLAGNWTGSLESAHENLKHQLDRDNSKRKYCKENGIDLIWITVDSDLDDFFQYLQDHKACAKWFHREHLNIEDWDNSFEKWLLFSYKKQDFLNEYRN